MRVKQQPVRTVRVEQTVFPLKTGGRETGDPNFYLSDVDKRIVKIRPMATPIDQISRYAKSSSTNSFEVKYYSVGTREIKCSTNKKAGSYAQRCERVVAGR